MERVGNEVGGVFGLDGCVETSCISWLHEALGSAKGKGVRVTPCRTTERGGGVAFTVSVFWGEGHGKH